MFLGRDIFCEVQRACSENRSHPGIGVREHLPVTVDSMDMGRRKNRPVNDEDRIFLSKFYPALLNSTYLDIESALRN